MSTDTLPHEDRRVSSQEPATVVKNSNQQDVAQIVKETLDALKGNNRPKNERAQKQREEIVRVLTETKGRVGGADGAAARMGINRTTLMSRMRKLGIESHQYV